MGYAGAGLGQGLQQGLGLLSQSLMGISDRKRQQSAYEAALKQQAADRAREEKRYNDSIAWRDKTREEDLARENERFELGDTVRRGTNLAQAFETANKYAESGRPAQINPGRVFMTGSPLDGTLGQGQTLEAESGVPTVTAGEYNPENDVGLKRQISLAEAYRGMGAGPKGQITPTGGSGGTNARAMAAARAVADVQKQFSSMIPFERDRLLESRSTMQKRINAVLTPFGFANMDELNRAMGGSGVGAEMGSPAEGEGTDPIGQQRMDWDAAANVLRAQNKDPVTVLGPRP